MKSASRPELQPGRSAAEQAAEQDRQSIAAVVRGDRDALADLYDRHGATMLRVARRFLKQRSDAEDLLHDVFVEAWERAASYDGSRGTVRAWLLLRVRSRAIDRIRSLETARRHAMAEATDPGSAAHAGPAGSGPDPEPGWDGPDRERARQAVETLSDKLRAVVELAYFEGFTCAEIAEHLGTPIGTVKSRLSSALSKLRDRLGPSGGHA